MKFINDHILTEEEIAKVLKVDYSIEEKDIIEERKSKRQDIIKRIIDNCKKDIMEYEQKDLSNCKVVSVKKENNG